MKISVCLIVYNGIAFLNSQLDSILSQSVQADEIVIVDDGSTDESWSYISAIASRYDSIKCYKNSRNLGVNATIQKACLKATGDWILFSDQDDIWFKDKIMVLKNAITCFPSADLFMSNAIIFRDSEIYISPSKMLFEKDISKISPMNVFVKNNLVGALMTVRRQFLVKICLPIPLGIGYHDQWIGMLCLALGSYQYIPQPLVYYRRHVNSLTVRKKSFVSIFSRRMRIVIAFILRLLSLYIKRLYA